ncbi:MAG: methyltransferase, partial [Acidobacteria bacterium]
MENGHIVIRRRGADRIRRGHVWVYQSDILHKDAGAGGIVSVRDERGAVLGKAFYSSKSQIALRLLARGDVPIDKQFFQDRFALADRLREQLAVDPLLSRRVYSEGDFLPGLIVDRYNDRLVVQSLIQATDAMQLLITEILSERYGPRSILFRNDTRVRELEGLELKKEVVGEPLPETLTVDEDGKSIALSLTQGQKTGSYLDQRDNQRPAPPYARGKALHAFTYAGG